MRRSRRTLVVAGLALVFVASGLAIAAAARVGPFRPATPTLAAGPPAFVDVAAGAGLEHEYTGPAIYQVGGGVAVLDCNEDGLPDLYLAGGESPAALFVNRSTVGGELSFERVESGLELPGVNGAYPLDITGDGHDDLAILAVGGPGVRLDDGDPADGATIAATESGLWQNDAQCRFSPAGTELGMSTIKAVTTAFSATWEPNRDLPTLAFGTYLALDERGERTFDCGPNFLFRPYPPNVSFGQYDVPIPLDPGYCALGMLFSDWDGSGYRDLRITNDRQYYRDGMDQLWRIRGGVPTPYTANDGWVAMQIWGMGIASQDLTGDGLPEVYLTSQGDNKLQTLTAGPSKPTFRDIALRMGVTATRPFVGDDTLPSTAWHPEFADVNNDGFTDLFVSKGNVGVQEGYAVRDPSNLFLGQADGTFVEAADRAGILNVERGRGAALVDLNLDGRLDLVEVNYLAETRLWRNAGAVAADAAEEGHWIAIDVTQDHPNRHAIGARLEIQVGERTEHRELVVGGGHAGGQLGWTHLGLGPATEARLRVTWPDGEVGEWLTLGADRFWLVERDVAEPRAWEPGP